MSAILEIAEIIGLQLKQFLIASPSHLMRFDKLHKKHSELQLGSYSQPLPPKRFDKLHETKL